MDNCPHGTHYVSGAQYAYQRCVADTDTTASVEQPSSGPDISLTDHSGGPGVVIVPIGLIALIVIRVLRAWWRGMQQREMGGRA